MKKYKILVQTGMLLAFVITGCAKSGTGSDGTAKRTTWPEELEREITTAGLLSEENMEMPSQKPLQRKNAETTPSPLARTVIVESKEGGSKLPAPPDGQALWAQDKMELLPGMTIEGVFDASRQIIRLSLEQSDGVKKLFVDGEEKLTVSENCEFRLHDILKEDACLELLAGEPAVISDPNQESKEGFLVTAYRLHPGELAEVPLLSAGEGNSFFIGNNSWSESWAERVDNWYFGNTFFAYIYDPAKEIWEEEKCQMMPEGYLMAQRPALAVINIDGEWVELCEAGVKIDQYTGVGIAFAANGTLMNSTHYNIYRSEDYGRNWSLMMEDFVTAADEIDRIYIQDENTIFIRFYPSGIWPGNAAYVTLNGGRTWELVGDVEETKKYDFLQSWWYEE